VNDRGIRAVRAILPSSTRPVHLGGSNVIKTCCGLIRFVPTKTRRKDAKHVEIFQSVTVSSALLSVLELEDVGSSRGRFVIRIRAAMRRLSIRLAFVSLVLNKKKHAPCLIDALALALALAPLRALTRGLSLIGDQRSVFPPPIPPPLSLSLSVPLSPLATPMLIIQGRADI